MHLTKQVTTFQSFFPFQTDSGLLRQRIHKICFKILLFSLNEIFPLPSQLFFLYFYPPEHPCIFLYLNLLQLIIISCSIFFPSFLLIFPPNCLSYPFWKACILFVNLSSFIVSEKSKLSLSNFIGYFRIEISTSYKGLIISQLYCNDIL